jgi:hypothetical protein
LPTGLEPTGLGDVLGLFRHPHRIEHNLRIGWLCQGLSHFVAVVTLIWVVATTFFSEPNDLCRFLLAEDRELQRHLLTASSHLIVMTLGNEDHSGEIEADC